MKRLGFFSIFFFSSFFSISYGAYIESEHPHRAYVQFKLPSGVVGPESYAVDCKGENPYTGVRDGRIFRWEGFTRRWTEFTITAPNRSRELCDGLTDPNLEPICGRPLGSQFNNQTCELYIADAYFGLKKVGRNGGVAIQLASGAEGVPFKFTNGLDIDQRTGAVYFTDSSTRYQIRDVLIILQTGDRTGRLMKFDPKTKKVTVQLKSLTFANGVALSIDNNYVLVSETIARVIARYWLKGVRACQSEDFFRVSGLLDNIKRNLKGEYWVGLNNGLVPSRLPIGVRLDQGGRVLETLFGDGSVRAITEVVEVNELLGLGSDALDYSPVTNTRQFLNKMLL